MDSKNTDIFEVFKSIRKNILLLFDSTGIYCEGLSDIISGNRIDKNNFRKLINEPAIKELGLFEQFCKNNDFEYLEKNNKAKL